MAKSWLYLMKMVYLFIGDRGGFRGGRGGGRGFEPQGPPAEVVEAGLFEHPCEGEAVCKLSNTMVRRILTDFRASSSSSSCFGGRRPCCCCMGMTAYFYLQTEKNTVKNLWKITLFACCRFLTLMLPSIWKIKPKLEKWKRSLGRLILYILRSRCRMEWWPHHMPLVINFTSIRPSCFRWIASSPNQKVLAVVEAEVAVVAVEVVVGVEEGVDSVEVDLAEEDSAEEVVEEVVLVVPEAVVVLEAEGDTNIDNADIMLMFVCVITEEEVNIIFSLHPSHRCHLCCNLLRLHHCY